MPPPVSEASLQSGYALLAQGRDTGIPSTIPAELPLIESETVFRQTRPPLYAAPIIPLLARVVERRDISLFKTAGIIFQHY